ELLVVDAVVGSVDWPRGGDGDWRDRVRAISLSMWRALREHPHAIPLILTRRSRSNAVIDVSEALLDALACSGRSGKNLLVAFRAVKPLLMGFAQVELASPLARAAGERAPVVIKRFRSLPRERYPHLIAVATAAMSSRPEAELRAGLDIVLRGLER